MLPSLSPLVRQLVMKWQFMAVTELSCPVTFFTMSPFTRFQQYIEPSQLPASTRLSDGEIVPWVEELKKSLWSYLQTDLFILRSSKWIVDPSKLVASTWCRFESRVSEVIAQSMTPFIWDTGELPWLTEYTRTLPSPCPVKTTGSTLLDRITFTCLWQVTENTFEAFSMSHTLSCLSSEPLTQRSRELVQVTELTLLPWPRKLCSSLPVWVLQIPTLLSVDPVSSRSPLQSRATQMKTLSGEGDRMLGPFFMLWTSKILIMRSPPQLASKLPLQLQEKSQISLWWCFTSLRRG